ncbi:panthothenate synthetase [Shewanella cyperi]|uniref:Panthothenate synthetase n=1 Tax=Shewanella cyperi TaxID=2814292 RepID=A0A974XMJ0_9GAMM|nr:panthothenate synthetase [Shewanella cyperi]QSX29786.1 panthothenate synthetase [Shewanella cyperi]QSX40569.1 panthothenate synthetase [Shewanella cyperi]
MKMLLTVEFPHEPFNTLVRTGQVGELIGNIMDSIKPEAAYFTEQNGCRCGVFVVEVAEPWSVPAIAEPFFLNFKANCQFRILMTPDDLQRAGLAELGRRWG